MHNDGENSYQLFLSGDENGLVQIIRDYKDGLMLYLNGFVSDMSVAEELTEDTFLKLVLKKPRFSAKSSFKTWLYTIGRNLTLDYLRRNRKKQISLEDCLEVADEEAELEAAYIHREGRRRIHQAMKTLKWEYRQVLWLIYFENFTCDQVAKIMGKSRHGIESLAYRARQSLKEKLNEEDRYNEKQ